jgi:hypothetical protein
MKSAIGAEEATKMLKKFPFHCKNMPNKTFPLFFYAPPLQISYSSPTFVCVARAMIAIPMARSIL